MIYLALKGLISGALVVAISELARRYSLLAALLASLPLTSMLAFIWLYVEEKNPKAVASLSWDILWLVIPSLAFFIALPLLLTSSKLNFWLALTISCLLTAACYALTLQIKQWL